MALYITKKRIGMGVFLSVAAVAIVTATLIKVSTDGDKLNALVETTQLQNVTQLEVNSSLACEIADAKAYCWQSDNFGNYGQLGNGTNTESSTPVPVSTAGVLAGKSVTDIATINQSACALADGKVYCWGQGTNGELGNGAMANSNIPVAVTGVMADKNVTDIIAGTVHFCAVAEGDIYCWGYGAGNRLGNGFVSNRSTPTPIDTSGGLSGKTITKIDIKSDGGCVLASGKVYCWGSNSNGQLGNGTHSGGAIPMEVGVGGVLDGKVVTDMATTQGTSCVTAEAKMYCWGGSNGDGQLGNGTTVPSSTPLPVDMSGVLFGKTIAKMFVGTLVTCVTTDQGSLYCWGRNDNGQLGNGTTQDSLVPSAVDATGVLAGKHVDTVVMQSRSLCALAESNVYCWGFGSSGNFGNGTNEDSLVPVLGARGILSNKQISSMQAGDDSMCVIAELQSYCWGLKGLVGLGNDDERFSSSSSLPMAVGSVVLIPEVVSVSPDNGRVDTDNGAIEIRGVDFDSGATVTIGGEEAQVTNRYLVNSILYVNPPISSTSGSRDVVVTNSNGQSATLANGYTYKELLPIVSSFSLGTDVPIHTSGRLLSIYGENLENTSVKIGNSNVQILLNTAEELQVEIPMSASTGFVDIVITTSDGQDVTISDAIRYSEVKQITNVSFVNESGISVMRIIGSELVNASNAYEYTEALSRSLVTLNGVAMKFCANGLASTYEGYGYSPDFFSNDIPCYKLVDASTGEIQISPTNVDIRLDDDFDITAQGTVSVNGSSTFIFNQQATSPGDGDDVEPTATVGGRSLENRPTISKRPTFSGVAEPGATVTVTVRSDPIVCTTIADSNGNWSCTLAMDLPPGNHTVTVRVINPDNSVEDLGPYSVVVAGTGGAAPVVTSSTPLAPDTGVSRVFGVQRGSMIYAAATALVVTAFVFAAYVNRRRFLPLKNNSL